MALSLGLNLGLGRNIVGTEPPVDADLPAILVGSKSNIVVVGAEALNPSQLVSLVSSKTTRFAYLIDGLAAESGGAGTGVTSLTDLGPGSIGCTASGTARPALSATGGPGGRACITLDGTTDVMAIAFDPPAPSATPTFMRLLARIDSGFTSPAYLIGSNATSNRFCIRILTGPVANIGNGSNGGSTLTLTTGVWYVFDALFNNAASDFIRVGTQAAVTGAAGGTDTASGFLLGSGVGTGFFKGAIAHSQLWNGQPTTAELNNHSAWLQKWYGASNIQVPTYP